MNIYSIYKIVCTITNKVYIGQTKRDINQRFKEHTRNNRSPRYKLDGSISKYGPENHYIETIFCCLKIEDLNEFEKYFEIEYDSLHNGLNTISAGQQGGFTKPKSFGETLSKSRIEKFKSGELKPVKSCLGKKLYVNLESLENKFFENDPGEGWILSKTYIKQKNEEKRKHRVNKKFLSPWHNVELHKEIRSEECPGEGWIKGRGSWSCGFKPKRKFKVEFKDGTFKIYIGSQELIDELDINYSSIYASIEGRDISKHKNCDSILTITNIM